MLTSEKLRERRLALGMSQEELARRAGVGRRTVVNAEAGSRQTLPAIWRALSEALGLGHECDGSDEAPLRLPPDGGTAHDTDGQS